jgi:predicted dehydrogenase
MNALIIGLGSMGKRRIRLLKENFPEITLLGIDQNIDRCQAIKREFSIETDTSIREAFSKHNIDYAFVCTSPLSHAVIISECLNNNAHVFTEINLVSDGYNKNIELAYKNNLVLFLSSTFLYRSEIKTITEKIYQSKRKIYYIYHIGQYLPDWHPWEKFSDFFVNDKRTNGCRELFAIELPWLIKAFGKIINFNVHKENFSNLNLGYPDTYFVTMEHEDGHVGELCIDVVSRIPIRHLEVFGEDIQIEWRGTPETLRIADNDFLEMKPIETMQEVKRLKGYRDFIVEDAYLEELKEFFAVCNGKTNNIYTFEDDFYTINLIDNIEQ